MTMAYKVIYIVVIHLQRVGDSLFAEKDTDCLLIFLSLIDFLNRQGAAILLPPPPLPPMKSIEVAADEDTTTQDLATDARFDDTPPPLVRASTMRAMLRATHEDHSYLEKSKTRKF